MKCPILTALPIAIAAAFLLTASPSPARTKKPPLFQKVLLVPITVEPLPFEGVPPQRWEGETARKLSDEATKQADRILLRSNLAATVVRGASAPEAGEGSAPIPVVSGTLRLPVSLPATVRGWDASRRKGRFASMTIVVTDPRTGRIIASGSGLCEWRDAWWIRTKHHGYHVVPLESVLLDFARKAAERSVRDAALSAHPQTPGMPPEPDFYEEGVHATEHAP